jgi:pimeloyl-ACP methyl ester carboxylesterase
MLQVVATNKVLVSQPYLCFFQGGPGFESPVPSESQQWLTAATKHFRVILLDQRGTGRSTPIRASTLNAVGNTEAQAAYLRHFRADNIVADAELLRLAMLANAPDGRWCVLGQSFGGFCCTRYLSYAPQGAIILARGALPMLS